MLNERSEYLLVRYREVPCSRLAKQTTGAEYPSAEVQFRDLELR